MQAGRYRRPCGPVRYKSISSVAYKLMRVLLVSEGVRLRLTGILVRGVIGQPVQRRQHRSRQLDGPGRGHE